MKTKINIETICEICHYLQKKQILEILRSLPRKDKNYILSYLKEFNLL